MLRIEHLTKKYGDKTAVEDLNLYIQPGEIYMGGESIKEQPLKCKSKIAYIPDNPDIYDYMTGSKYLNFIADIFKVSATDRKERIHKYADLFEITDEPFVGLAPKTSHLLKEMMREFCDNGRAIFFSTHVLEAAEKLCDKVAIIKGGKLIRQGTMVEVKGDASLENVFLEFL